MKKKPSFKYILPSVSFDWTAIPVTSGAIRATKQNTRPVLGIVKSSGVIVTDENVLTSVNKRVLISIDRDNILPWDEAWVFIMHISYHSYETPTFDLHTLKS